MGQNFYSFYFSVMPTKSLQESIGGRIQLLRLNAPMTQAQLAVKCDFDKATLSKIENGKQNITLSTLSKICKALNTDISALFCRHDIENLHLTQGQTDKCSVVVPVKPNAVN